MLISKSVPLIIVCGIGAIGWAGCGDSSDSTSTAAESEAGETSTQAEAPPEVTKEDYIAAADKECKAYRDDSTKLSNQRAKLVGELQTAYSSETAKQVQEVVSQLAEDRRELTKTLQGLEQPPSGDAGAYFESREETAKAIEASAKAWGDYADEQTEATSTALNEAIAAEDKAIKANAKEAEKYGFEVCGVILNEAKK